jgi:hypothetical protein
MFSRYAGLSQHDVKFILINLLRHMAARIRTNENLACVTTSVRLIRVLIEPLLPTKRPTKRDRSQLYRAANLIFFACYPSFGLFYAIAIPTYVRCLLHTNVTYSRDIPCLLYCFSSMSHRIARRDVPVDWK